MSERLRDIFERARSEAERELDKNVVDHPKRYGGDTTYECIKVLKAWLTPEEFRGFCKGNAIKYLCRLGAKDDEVRELEKSRWYIAELMKAEEEYGNEER